MGFLIFLGMVGALGIGVVLLYNGLVRARNEVHSAWSSIDVQLKRRHDLVPNLVETVRGYAAHEKTTLDEVVKARQEAALPGRSMAEREKAENALTESLRQLFALAEAYPDLKANQNFLQLQQELSATENKISFSRQYYNDAAMRYKNRVEMFPSNLVASLFGFKPQPFFQLEAPQEERRVPEVVFGQRRGS